MKKIKNFDKYTMSNNGKIFLGEELVSDKKTYINLKDENGKKIKKNVYELYKETYGQEVNFIDFMEIETNLKSKIVFGHYLLIENGDMYNLKTRRQLQTEDDVVKIDKKDVIISKLLEKTFNDDKEILKNAIKIDKYDNLYLDNEGFFTLKPFVRLKENRFGQTPFKFKGSTVYLDKNRFNGGDK